MQRSGTDFRGWHEGRMGGAGRTCSFLPALRGRDSGLEVAKCRSERVARVLGQPFVLATDRARTHGTRGAKCAARRAQGLVFVSAEFFASMADSFGWRSRSGAGDFRWLAYFASARPQSGQRQIALEEQRPKRRRNRGIVIRTCDRQARGGSQATTRKYHDGAASELSRKIAGPGYRHRPAAPSGRLEPVHSPTPPPVPAPL